MRPLSDEELRAVFEKLQTYIGGNISKLIDRQVHECNVFHLYALKLNTLSLFRTNPIHFDLSRIECTIYQSTK